MKIVRALVLAITVVSASAWAVTDDQHQAHHPAGATTAPASKVMSGSSSSDMASMDTQMKAMQEMHEKMMAAKTPEERNVLMAEHMKTMQDGMTMMNGMSPGGMKCDMKGDMKGNMKGDMAAHHQMMEKRMEMMHSMMQMMMDRLPPAPAKP